MILNDQSSIQIDKNCNKNAFQVSIKTDIQRPHSIQFV